MSKSESEPKVKTIWICPKCGWVRPPKYFQSRNCEKCNSSLVPKIVKAENCISEEKAARNIIGYTDEYRDAHWHQCTRYNEDPRTCGSLHAVWKGREGKICGRDSKDCDAKWTGEKECSG
jgi:hypothetical protein